MSVVNPKRGFGRPLRKLARTAINKVERAIGVKAPRQRARVQVPMQPSQRNSAKRKAAEYLPERPEKKQRLEETFAPTSIGYRRRPQRAPRFGFRSSSEGGTAELEHSEIFAVLPGSTTFTNTAIAIQPGLATVFPYGSKMAALFETYEFESLAIDYIPRVSSAKDGAVMMAMDYDAADSAPVNMFDMMSLTGAVQGNAWERLTINFDRRCMNKLREHFIRTSSLGSNLDIKTYDTAVLYIATDAMVSTANIGVLQLRYVMRLHTPQLASLSFVQSTTAQYTGLVTVASVAGASTPFLTSPVWTPTATDILFGQSAAQVPVFTNSALIFPTPGSYYVTLKGTLVTTPVETGATWTISAGAGSVLNDFVCADSAASKYVCATTINLTKPSTLTLNLSSTASSWIGAALSITFAWLSPTTVYEHPTRVFAPRQSSTVAARLEVDEKAPQQVETAYHASQRIVAEFSDDMILARAEELKKRKAASSSASARANP